MKHKIYPALIASVFGFIAVNASADHETICEDKVTSTSTYYYGPVACEGFSSKLEGWITIDGHVSRSAYPSIKLYKNVPYAIEGGHAFELISCTAQIPYAGTDETVERVCTKPEHEPLDIVAVANVNSDDMRVVDQQCSWGGWSYITYARANTLSCNGQPVATVQKSLHWHQTGQCSVHRVADGYSYSSSYSGSCNINILKK